MEDYGCRRCGAKVRLIVWTREEGYLCALCGGDPGVNQMIEPKTRWKRWSPPATTERSPL